MSKGVRVSHAVLKTYEHLDPIAEARAKELKATCKTGCNHCCHQLATITVVEGLLIAEKLLEKPDWKALLPVLREKALAACFDGVNKNTYYEKRIACAFLREGLCSIYEIRPSPCRYHYVVSDPSRCDPEHGEGTTAIIDMLPLEEMVWGLSETFIKENPKLQQHVLGPIPLMVLYSMAITLGNRDQDLLKAIEGLPTPGQYLGKYLDSIQNVEKPRKATEEEIAHMKKVH